MKTIEHREFFKLTALASGGFMLRTEAAAENEERAAPPFEPSPFISIGSDGTIMLTSHMPDMGQGVKTSLPMLIAEELEVDWEQVKIKTEVVDKKLYGRQNAGGSQSVARNYDRLRRLGAAAKSLLIEAAAKEWGVPQQECEAASAVITHATSKRTLSYGELAQKASQLEAPNPKSVTLKDSKDFKIIGKRIGGVDNQAIVTGKPLYGIDQVQAGLKYASFVRSPAFGGEVKKANLEEIQAKPGISAAFIIKGKNAPYGLSGGVAIIADSTWHAFQAQEALQVEWNDGDQSKNSTAQYAQAAEQAMAPQKEEGLDVVYHYPHLAPNTLEPQNCTALFKDGVFEIWAPTQSPDQGIRAIAKILKVKPNQIKVHLTRLGGGFGRRSSSDFMVEAAAIAKEQAGTPIKLTWTREQDIQHDFYRAPSWHHLQGSVDKEGRITSFSDDFITMGHNNRKPGTAAGMNKREFPLEVVADSKFKQTVLPTNVPFGWWRAPGSNGIAFAIQSFLDELAHAAQKDPVEFRMGLLDSMHKGRFDSNRMKGVLQAVTKKAEWGKTLPKGSAQGVAFHYSHRGYVAVVAEVSVSKAGELKINRMTAAADVGPILNLSGAEGQVMGSMLDGLSSAWYQKIEIENGAVQNSNFDDYPALRMPQASALEVVFVESDSPPTGLGEPALPPTIPAICNAIFAASGKRIRTLPINGQDLSWA